MNLKRRHLTAGQKAMVAADALPLFEKEAKKRQGEHGGTAPGKRKNTGGNNATSEKSKARDDAAKSIGVSARYVSDAKAIKKKAPALAKKEHVFKMNLLRRHLDPLSWGKAFKKLLKLLGVKRGAGKRNDLTSVKVTEVANELGVKPSTAEKRLKLADDYDGLPAEEQAKVDAGEKSVKAAIAKALKKESKSNTQAVIARKLGVSQPTVAGWLTPNIKTDNACKSATDSRVKIPPTENAVILDRIEDGESQEQVAADYGVTQQAISRIATKEKKPDRPLPLNTGPAGEPTRGIGDPSPC